MSEANKQSRVEFSRIEVGIVPNARNKLKNIRELAADIKERGLLHPLLVWHKRIKKEPYELHDGRTVWDRYILIGGHRRHAAITLIRDEDPGAFESIAVVLFHGNEDDAMFAALADNLSREDLSTAELAQSVYLLKMRGHTQAVIARRLSKSQAYVSRLLKLRENLAPTVLEAVGTGELPFDTALALADREEAVQLRALERFRNKLVSGDRRGASADLKAGIGRVTKPPVKDIRAHIEFLSKREGLASRAGQARIRIARQILAWSIGEGEWPSELPAPPKSE